MNRPTNDFLRSLQLTASARFFAAQRLTILDSRITLLNVGMAFYIIALTIIPKFVEMPFGLRNWFELMTVVLAIMMLAFTLLQFSSKNALRSEKFHRSALDIQEIHRFLQFKGFNVSEREFQEMSKRFDEILQRDSLNHEPVDGFQARCHLPDGAGVSGFEKNINHLRVWLASGYPLVVLGLLTIFLFVSFVDLA